MHHSKNHWRGKPIAPDWRDQIQVGDVLLTPSGTERIVREVTRHGNLIGWVAFVILHCSWTTRCYTTMTRSDLKHYSNTNHKIKLDKRIDKKINNALHEDKISVTCCDVEGIR